MFFPKPYEVLKVFLAVVGALTTAGFRLSLSIVWEEKVVGSKRVDQEGGGENRKEAWWWSGK